MNTLRADRFFEQRGDAFLLLLDLLPIPVFLKDIEGRYRGCNRQYEVLSGKSREQLLNRTVYDLWPREQADIFYKKDLELLENGPTQKYRADITGSLSRKCIVEFHKSVIYDHHEPVGIFGAIFDITEMVEAREGLTHAKEVAEQATKSKAELLSMMSHEIRSPLHAILSYAYLGLKRTDDPKLSECLEIISASGERTSRLIDNILDLSRLESGKFTVDCADHDIEACVSRAIKEVKSLANRKCISIVLHASVDAPCRFDIDLITQVVVNLLSNAIKFSPENSEIAVSLNQLAAETAPVGPSNLEIIVTDQGVGIASSDLESVFHRFTQSQGTKQPGSGLGLYISRQIVELHHGTIWAESPPAGRANGTALHVRIPCVLNQTRPAPADQPAPGEPTDR